MHFEKANKVLLPSFSCWGASSLLAALVSPVLKRRPSRQAPPGPHPPGALKGI